ncbi:putative MFS family arabinose efflux permease [Kribbella voronezhensis]|uniref:Putative MFS family arabinose efflux permease n=1 Tax=Kribbella voronezhensis TaxID=2512212 RepID=A0A4R7SX74_9ACTN|nr:MFS transporter [Kribbella voronezhensis]TDU83962.1 putative MFS family arabinose efflux permease [Kribbella voronezhensis]
MTLQDTTDQVGLSGAAVTFMSIAAALGTSTLYLLQPSVGQVAGSLGSPIGDIGLALACGPIGYLLGLLVLTPLVDRYSPRRVLAAQFLVLAIALGASAMVQDVAVLGLLIAITGTSSVVGSGMSSIVGRLAAPHRRGTILGIVTSGISAGIIAGRIVGGFLADRFGWRVTLLIFAGASAVFALLCARLLTDRQAAVSGSLFTTIRSIPGLFVRYATLRTAALRGALWFFGFCTVWSGLAVALAEPPFNYSPERIGFYGLAGLSGIAATQVAGRWTDRVGARKVILFGLALAVVATIVSAATLHLPAVTMACLALFDAGLFAAQVANQSTVLAIDPSAPARLNGGYMVVYFVGGSLGTAFGPSAVAWFGWGITALTTVAAMLIAALLTILSHASRGGRTKSPVIA